MPEPNRNVINIDRTLHSPRKTLSDSELVTSLARHMANILLAEGVQMREQRLMDMEDAAHYLGRTVGAVQQMVKRGVLPVVKLDARSQIDKRKLDQMIIESEVYS